MKIKCFFKSHVEQGNQWMNLPQNHPLPCSKEEHKYFSAIYEGREYKCFIPKHNNLILRFRRDISTNFYGGQKVYLLIPEKIDIKYDDLENCDRYIINVEEEHFEEEHFEEEHFEEDITRKKEIINPAVYYESDIENLLVKYPDWIEEGLKILGNQVQTSTGPLDLLCEDKDGNIVIVELKYTKHNKADDKTVGQVLRYKGWAEEKEEFKDKKIRVIILGDKFHKRLEMSVKGSEFIELRKLRVRLKMDIEKIIN